VIWKAAIESPNAPTSAHISVSSMIEIMACRPCRDPLRAHNGHTSEGWVGRRGRR
jgi:hypothetical protein